MQNLPTNVELTVSNLYFPVLLSFKVRGKGSRLCYARQSKLLILVQVYLTTCTISQRSIFPILSLKDGTFVISRTENSSLNKCIN